MTRLDTPTDARTGKAALAGQEQGKHKRLGSSEEGGAFGALLKTLDAKKAPQGAATSDKNGDATLAALLDEAESNAPGDAAKDPAQPATEQATPAGASLAAAARLLLGPFQLAEHGAPEARKGIGAKDAGATAGAFGEDGSRAAPIAAALSDLLAEAGPAGSREAGTAAAHAAKPERPSRPEAGIMMPGWNDKPQALREPTRLARLSDASGDKPAASADLARLDELVGLEPSHSGDRSGAAQGREFGPAAAPVITVLHQETHLPPMMRLSPFQQVIEPIRQAATELLATRGADAIPELDSGKAAEIDTPTKLLHIELKPVELGTIVVKMRLSHAGMIMRIETSRAETATMLGKDTHALREIIRASGYAEDMVSVETVHVDAMAGDWQRTHDRQDGFRNDGPDARPGRDAQGFRHGDQGQDARRQARTPDMPFGKDDSHEMPDAGRPGGDPHLYL